MAKLNDTEVNGNLTVSGGGSFTEDVSAPNIDTLIENFEHYDVPIYTDANNAMLGLTDDTTLNELVEGGIVPVNSIVKTWVNGNSAYGREIREVLNTLFHKNIYGVLTIERIGQERHLTIKSYDTLDTYSTTYTEVNGRGWYGTWLQTCGKNTTWYFYWNGAWVAVIEYQDFFFVYIRGTIGDNINQNTYYTMIPEISFTTNCCSPIFFTGGQYGEVTINTAGIALCITSGAIGANAWICGQAFVYKMPA